MKNFLSSLLLTLSLAILISTQLFAETNQPIMIGVILPLTGEAGDFGHKIAAAIEAEKQEGIEFIFEDDACHSNQAITGYQNLRNKGVQYFLGPCCGASMKPVAPRLANGEQLALATCPLSEEVYKISGGNVLLPFYSIDKEASFNADYIYKSGHEKVVLIFQETEFGRLQEKSFRDSFKGKIPRTFTYNTPDVNELRPILLKLKQLDYDAIYIPMLEPFMLGILKEMKKVGITKPVYSIFSCQMKEILALNEDAAEGLTYSYPDVPLDVDAITYFPQIGAKILISAIKSCSGEYKCVVDYIKSHNKFSSTGMLEQEIRLKTVKNGKYTFK